MIKGWDYQSISKELRLFNGGEITTSQMPYLYNWFWTAKLGLPRKANIIELRQYAKSGWVNMIINTILKQLMITKWDIVSNDEEDETDYSKDILKAKTFLEQPNRNGQTFWEIWGPFMRDVLELDAGVIYKGRNGKNELTELFVYDGSRFLYDVDEFGIFNGFYQYSYRQPKNVPKFFENNELIYGKIGNNTEFYPYGWSPLQSIVQEIELLIQSTRYNKEYYKNNAVPDGIVSIPMEGDELERFKTGWEQQVKGKPHKLIFHNSEANFTPLSLSNKDMEWLEGQKWYFHMVFAAWGLSPQEAGFYENSNRSTGESQERISVKNAIAPYLKLISEKITWDILVDLLGHDKLKFKWFPKDEAGERIEHEQKMAKLNANVLTINEVRKMDGLDPVEWGDKPMAIGMQERAAEQQEAFADKEDNPKDKEDNIRGKPSDRDEKKSVTKDVDAGEEMVEEAKDYAEFLQKKFGIWEKKIMSFVDTTLKDETVDKAYINKSFGDFIQRLFNSVNTQGFITGLKAVIKTELNRGIDDAENELNVDVGFSMGKEVDHLVNRQLDGFYINGQKWEGIKGVADDLQKEIRKIVVDGIAEKQTTEKIKSEIKGKLDQYVGGKDTEGRAMKIARTESNRFYNSAKIETYKQSGLKGKKVWDSFIDDRTSPICRSLDHMTASLDSEFIDPKTGKGYQMPPSHVNCRSTVRFKLDD